MALDSKKKVSDMLWESAYWKQKIFDLSLRNIKRSNVDALFLAMRAFGIMVVKKHRNILCWNIAREDIPGGPNQGAPLCASNEELFSGIHLFPDSRPRKNDPDNVTTAAPTPNQSK